ncbi:hypothetical protein FUAX_54540 (plasmid) [Fulvitalea axinellae]|uniref:Uncharacterized protein n=1 Tax=Fulvitalea axinellae TaxID=1182444 RepID=A0AAU9D1L0_9BACT|nr:hypothetical protein FUAX_54540 [Fulvitalea axinellae]
MVFAGAVAFLRYRQGFVRFSDLDAFTGRLWDCGEILDVVLGSAHQNPICVNGFPNQVFPERLSVMFLQTVLDIGLRVQVTAVLVGALGADDEGGEHVPVGAVGFA